MYTYAYTWILGQGNGGCRAHICTHEKEAEVRIWWVGVSGEKAASTSLFLRR